MRRLPALGLAVLVATLLLGGCGSGDLGYLYDFFGNGTSTGGGGTPVNGALVGTVFQRTADSRILILENTAVANADRAAVVGATVAVPALGKTTTTDALGRYLLGGVAAGPRDVVVTLPAALGGASATFRVQVLAGQVIQGIPSTPEP